MSGLGVLVVGALVRAVPILANDFPLNDGGLFFAMVAALRANGWLLPDVVEWNGNHIPFTYPPGGFYVTGLVAGLAPSDPLLPFRLLPLVFSALVPPAVYLFARRLLGSMIGAAAAALTYALAPASYTWLLNGGGITRAPGLLLAILSLWLLLRLLDTPGLWRGAALGATAGLTALVHPGAGLFVAVSGLLIVSAHALRVLRRGPMPTLATLTLALGLAVAIAAPWLVHVIGGHGLDALVGVSPNGPDPRSVLVAMVAARVTGSGFADPLAALVLAAALLQLLRRQWLLPAWWLVASLLSDQYGIVPASLLVGAVAHDLAELAAAGAAASGRRLHARRVGRIGLAILAAFLVVEGVASVQIRDDPGSHLHALSPERREAMSWVAANLPSDARVAVLTGDQWAIDPDSEWFYLLADRVSVATVQGYEWLGPGRYLEQQVIYQSLQRCAQRGGGCIRAWLERWPANYLFIPKGHRHGPRDAADCCLIARNELSVSSRVVYDGPGATIYDVSAAPGG